MDKAYYRVYTDAGSRGNPGIAAAATVLLDDEGKLVDFNGHFLGIQTNNIAEYEGILLGVKLALSHKISYLHCIMDSELVIKQINREYKVKDQRLLEKWNELQALRKNFTDITFGHVLRKENAHADKLVNIILDTYHGTSTH